ALRADKTAHWKSPQGRGSERTAALRDDNHCTAQVFSLQFSMKRFCTAPWLHESRRIKALPFFFGHRIRMLAEVGSFHVSDPLLGRLREVLAKMNHRLGERRLPVGQAEQI